MRASPQGAKEIGALAPGNQESHFVIPSGARDLRGGVAAFLRPPAVAACPPKPWRKADGAGGSSAVNASSHPTHSRHSEPRDPDGVGMRRKNLIPQEFHSEALGKTVPNRLRPIFVKSPGPLSKPAFSR